MTLAKFINKFITDDCIKIMNEIPNESIDCIITSPPYNIRAYNNKIPDIQRNRDKKISQKMADLSNNGYDTYNDNMKTEEYIKWQQNCLLEMFRILKTTGAIFYNHKQYNSKYGMRDLATPSVAILGKALRQIITWDKSVLITFNEYTFANRTEQIYLIAKLNCKLNRQIVDKGDIWRIQTKTDKNHPASFPIEIPTKCIAAMKNCDIVLDPFSGAGTTACAAYKADKNFIAQIISEMDSSV